MSQTNTETTVQEITRLMAGKNATLNTPDEKQHGIALNAVVRLKSTVRKPACPADRQDNTTAKVSRYMSKFNEPELNNYPVMLDSDLHGNRMWNIKDLELA